MQVRLIVVGGIKRQLQVATDDKYLYRAAEGHQRRWRQFAPDEGFRADTRGYMGLGSVRAYIQTGNAVFHANEVDAIGLPEKIKVEIGTRHGFAPEVVLFGRWMRWKAPLRGVPILKPLQIPNRYT